GHRLAGRFDAETFEQFGHYGRTRAMMAYGRTKLLDLLFAMELAGRLDPARTTVNALCPGFVATNLARSAKRLAMAGDLLSATPLSRTPAQGARMSVRLACDPKYDGVTGKYFSSTPGAGFLPLGLLPRNAAVRRRVFERTAELVGL